jgi:hypothetical protein
VLGSLFFVLGAPAAQCLVIGAWCFVEPEMSFRLKQALFIFTKHKAQSTKKLPPHSRKFA